MRELFLIIYGLTVLVAFGTMIFVATSKNKNKLNLFMLLLISAIAGVINMFTLFVSDSGIAVLLFTIFTALMPWASYYNFSSMCDYTDSMALKERFSWVFFDAAILDSVFIMLNLKTGLVLSARLVGMYGVMFYRIQPLRFYFLHMMVFVGTSIASILILAVALFRSAAFYRFKYAFVLVAEAIVIVSSLLYLKSRAITNLTVLSYVLYGLIMAVATIVIVPSEFLKRALSKFVKDSDEALIAFDVDGYLTYKNSLAEERWELCKKVINSFITFDETGKLPKNKLKDFSIKKSTTENDKKVVIQIEHKRLMDDEHHFLGNYFTVRDITREEENIEAQLYALTHDALTGLYNRKYFEEQASAAMAASPDETWVLACSNVDEFKIINDVFGFDVGDDILMQIAESIRESAPTESVFGRLGADRFAILMRKDIFSEMHAAGYNPKSIKNKANESYPLIIKIGICEITDTSMKTSIAIDRCYLALNSIKGDYQRHTAHYDDSIRNSILKERNLSGDLDKAIENDEFKLYLQPQVLGDGKTVGAEALVRWLHKGDDGNEKFIFPGDFITVYENNGLISRLDMHIWEKACILLKKWKDEGREDVYLSVNISPKDFYFVDICDVFEGLVSKYGISKNCIKLEITETALMSNSGKHLSVINRLREAGFIVEMDDFGSGYSSLTMLKDFDVDVIKLDMGFLKGEGNKEKTDKILQMVVNLTKSLGSQVIAEGVETKEQVDFLVEVGCDVFQGYYFAKPMSVEEFEKEFM